MTFNSHYWPSLDNSGEWNKYQVNKIVRGAVHPDGQIDVLERKYIGDQYITLLQHPDFPVIAEVYSSDPAHNVPPTQILPGCLYLGVGPDGIGEIRNNLNPPELQIPPILILPNNTTPGTIIRGTSKISGAPTGSFDWAWSCGVTQLNWVWPDSVRTWLQEPDGHYYNYAFKAGTQPRGLVAWWEGYKNPDGSFTGGLEYWAIGSGKI